MKVLHSPSWAFLAVLGGGHPNLVSLECYRPTKPFPHLPHAVSHSMDMDVRSCPDLFWGETRSSDV